MIIREITALANMDGFGLPSPISGVLFGGEDQAHKFIIRREDGTAFAGTVTAKFLRYADDVTVPLTGSIEDGAATVTLIENCYMRPGRFKLTMYVTESESTTAVYCCMGTVDRTDGQRTVDPGSEITLDVTDLINQIDEAVDSIPPTWTELSDEVDELKSAIDRLCVFPPYSWNIGKNISSAGVLQNNTSMALTSNFAVNGGDIIKNTTPAKDANNYGLLFYVNQYINGVWQKRTQVGSGQTIELDVETDTANIGYGRAGSAGVIMTQDDVDTYFSAEIYSNATYMLQRNGFAGNSFLENTKFGFWNLSPNVYSGMTDKPESAFNGGFFLNLPAGSSAMSREQIIYDIIKHRLFVRYLFFSTVTHAYSVSQPWKTVDFTDLDQALISRTAKTETSLAANTEIGGYRLGSYAQIPVSGYLDMPTDNFGGGTLTVLPTGGSNGIMQILVEVTTGCRWTRYISGSSLQNVGAWNADKGIKWAAIGDSITYGVYSTGSSSTGVNQAKCYAKRVANAIGVQTFSNLGVRGLGFVHAGNNGETLKDNVIDATTWTDYNLVTVALGVNDYYGVSNIGSESSAAWDGTVYGNIKGTIESIMSANPAIKLVFITPFNMSKYGDASTHWGKGYSRNHIGTLNDVKDAIVYWCEYYGIEYINETDYSPINDLNITSMLLDGLHPSWTAHEQIAHELIKKIPFA